MAAHVSRRHPLAAAVAFCIGLAVVTLVGGAWFLLEGWVHSPVACYVAPDGTVTQTDIAPQPPLDLSPYRSEEIFAPARDGTKIPLSIVYRKGTKRDGQAPLLLEAYGAYGITLDPAFLARWLAFLDLVLGFRADAHRLVAPVWHGQSYLAIWKWLK